MSPSASPAIDPRTVRSQALWAAIAAAMMLYIGFTYSLAVDAFPAQLLFMTLRYGGIAMAVSAVLLLTGWPAALMIDGVFAMIIGAALALAGALWIIEIRTVDLQTILQLVFGYLFFTSGLRGFRDYCKLGEITASAAEEVVTATAPGHATGTPPIRRANRWPPSSARRSPTKRQRRLVLLRPNLHVLNRLQPRRPTRCAKRPRATCRPSPRRRTRTPISPVDPFVQSTGRRRRRSSRLLGQLRPPIVAQESIARHNRPWEP
jgi:hypothetical protein